MLTSKHNLIKTAMTVIDFALEMNWAKSNFERGGLYSIHIKRTKNTTT
jgi:hypothetical protein